jgi:hypothetical protein
MLARCSLQTQAVIPALGAGIHALGFEESKAWIPGPSPGMTTEWLKGRCDD